MSLKPIEFSSMGTLYIEAGHTYAVRAVQLWGYQDQRHSTIQAHRKTQNSVPKTEND